MIDCDRLVKIHSEPANFLKAKEFQILRVGTYELEDNQNDQYTEASESKELRDTASEVSRDSVSEESGNSSDKSTEYSEKMANWWSD
jgi:hypothetical protein